MPKAKKLPSGNWRALAYSHTEKVLQPDGSTKNVRRYESFTATTKKEAEYLAAQFALDKKRIQTTSYNSLTLSQAIDKYIERSDAVLSPTTIGGYRQIQRNRFQSIMDIPIGKLTNEILRLAVNNEVKKPTKRKKKNSTVSPKTVSNAYSFISSVLKAYRPELDTTCKLPSMQNNIKELLPPEIILDVIKDTKIELACLLAMWLSFSSSEIRGLSKSRSIDGDYITIRNVIVDVDGKPIEKETAKEFTRHRRLKIPAYIKALIEKLPPEQDYLVELSGRAIYKRWTRLLQKNNLPHMTFHDLRHVNASVMALLRVPDKYAQERGGWKTDKVMKSVYQQTFSEERERVDTLIDQYFESKMQHEMQHKKKDPA